MNEQPYKWMNLKEDGIILTLKVIPNSSKNLIVADNDFLKIKLTAPAVDNKANKALIEYLSKHLKIPKTSINLISGTSSKNKKIKIPKISPDLLYSLIS